MSKTVMGLDNARFELAKETLDSYKEKLNEIKNEFDSLGLRELKESDLSLIHRGVELVEKILVENIEIPKHEGVKVSEDKYRKKALEYIDKPNTNRLSTLALDLLEYSQSYSARGSHALSMNDFEIEGNEIVVKKSTVLKLEQSCTFYIENKNEEEMFSAIKSVCDSINKIASENQKYNFFNRFTFSQENQGWIQFDGTAFNPNIRKIKSTAASMLPA